MLGTLYNIGIFVIFLGPLIFFHELGHFLFAKYFGVRVETFSIGFGPKLFKFKRGDTTYAISLIPLGGYVKMFGDNMLEKDSLPEEERQYAFTHKTKWQRFWIVFGGPFANFLMAYVIFFFLLFAGEKVPEPKIGIIQQNTTLYEKGLRTGDVLKEIDGEAVIGFTDLAASSREDVSSVVVMRDGAPVKLGVNMLAKDFLQEIMTKPPLFRAPYLINKKGEIWALTYNQTKVDESKSILSFAEDKEQTAFLVKVKDIESSERVYDYQYVEEVFLPQGIEKFNELIDTKGLFPFDMRIKSIVVPSPAEKVGIKAGDIIYAVNGDRVRRLENFRSRMQSFDASKAVKVDLYRGENLVSFEFKPEVKELNGVKRNTVGIFGSEVFVAPNLINTPSLGFIDSFFQAHVRTWETMVATFVGYKKLILGEVPMKSVGGPIAIAKVASDSFGVSLSYFIKIMALISINLGIINLFPIPVLDGGHIMFILFELVRGKPVSRKMVEVSMQFGISVLFLLIFMAIFNDVARLFS